MSSLGLVDAATVDVWPVEGTRHGERRNYI